MINSRTLDTETYDKHLNKNETYNTIIDILACLPMSLKETIVHVDKLKINSDLSNYLIGVTGAVNIKSRPMVNPDKPNEYMQVVVITKSSFDSSINKVNEEVLVELTPRNFKLNKLIEIIITLMQVTNTDFLIYYDKRVKDNNPKPLRLNDLKELLKKANTF